MKTATFYHYTSCSQCRATRKTLEQKNIQLNARDFFKQPFTEPELRALLKKTKRRPRDLFSYKSPSVKLMHLNPDQLTDEQMLQLMLQEPRLIRRPMTLVTNPFAGETALIIGSDKSALDAL